MTEEKGNLIMGKSGGPLFRHRIKLGITDNKTAWHLVPPGMMPWDEGVTQEVILPKCLF